MINTNMDLMPEVGKYVFQEVKYVINSVGCSENLYFFVKNLKMCKPKSYRFCGMTQICTYFVTQMDVCAS